MTDCSERRPGSQRVTQEVLADHLDLAQIGDLETDIARNFSTSCVLLTTYGTFRGHEGVRRAAKLLDEQIGRTRYEYRTALTEGEVGFLEWTAKGKQVQIDDGADSYFIRSGVIEIMTIHYTLREQLPETGSR